MEINGLGINHTQYQNPHTGVAHRAVTQFRGTRTTDSMEEATPKSKPGIISRSIGCITFIPSMIFNAVWTTVKYSVYLLTCGLCCKLGHDHKAMQAALRKVIEGTDSIAAFTENFPRGLDQLNALCVDKVREAEIGPKDNTNPKKVAEWNQARREDVLEELNEKWNEQNEGQIQQAIGFLQELIDAKAKN